jgi:hypothetical protein
VSASPGGSQEGDAGNPPGLPRWGWSLRGGQAVGPNAEGLVGGRVGGGGRGGEFWGHSAFRRPEGNGSGGPVGVGGAGRATDCSEGRRNVPKEPVTTGRARVRGFEASSFKGNQALGSRARGQGGVVGRWLNSSMLGRRGENGRPGHPGFGVGGEADETAAVVTNHFSTKRP